MRPGFITVGIIYFFGTLATIGTLLVHIPMPPLWIIVGPLIGRSVFRLFNGQSDILSIEGDCPVCQADLGRNVIASKLPFNETCTQCGQFLAISSQSFN